MRVLWRDREHICFFCREKLTRSNRSIDHLTPLSRGGKNKYSNFVLACKDCNHAKNSMTLHEFYEFCSGFEGGIDVVKKQFGFGSTPQPHPQ